jgi:hypothetical protein
VAQPDVLPTEPPIEPIVPMLMGDEIPIPHEPVSSPLDFPNIAPQAAPPLLGSGYTVTVANPTPPTNVSSVACGTPPHFTALYGADPRSPTYMIRSDDLALMTGAGAPGSLTAIATPVAGGSGPVAEATGTVVVVTAPGSVTAAPTQAISVQGNFTTTPNASHPSAQAPAVLPTIASLTPSAPVGNGGSVDLVVAGAGFRPDSVVYVAGVPQITQYVSPTSLHVGNAPKRTSAGTSAIVVFTGGVQTAVSTWTFS